MKVLDRRARRPDPGGWRPLPGIAPRSLRQQRLLRETGSLTAALQRHGPTTVTVLKQRLARPDRDELRMMVTRPHRLRMVREVVLRVGGVPWVFAHTVANPAGCDLLRRAGTRPLAAVLFADPRVKRGALHYRRIDARHPLHRMARPWSPGPGLAFDARRALFRRGAAAVLVTEVFLALP